MDRPDNPENQPDTADFALPAIGVPFSYGVMRERVSAAFELKEAFAWLSLEYQAELDEVLTKINILRAEFEHLHEYSPIEHVTTRLKIPKSIMKKMRRKGDVPRERAGVRTRYRGYSDRLQFHSGHVQGGRGSHEAAGRQRP